MADYPGSIPTLTNPSAGDKLNSPSHASLHTAENGEIIAIATELGTDPKGIHASVKARLEAIEAGGAALPVGGDAGQMLSKKTGSDFDVEWATETDPVVGAITGIVKADGAGTISAASAGTDYQAPIEIASQAEAEAWTDSAKMMTSQRVSQSFIKKTTFVDLSVSTGAVATDCSLGHHFNLVPDDSFTLSNPTNAYDGQGILWRIKQDATGSRVITLGNKFIVSSEIGTLTLSTDANAVDYVGAVYDSTDDKFEIIAFSSKLA